MLNFSAGELLLVTVVALIVLGPKQLPVIAERLGKWLKQGRSFLNTIQSEFTEQMQQQKLAENEKKAQEADIFYQTKSKSNQNQKRD